MSNAQQPVVQEWSVRWTFHGEPPTGLPRVLAVEYIAARKGMGARNGELAAIYARTLQEVPRGFGLCWTRHDRPPKRRSAEQRAAQRRGNLRRRIEAQAPLFADELEARELAAKPGYYAGEKDTSFIDGDDAARAALFEDLAAGDMGMTVYCQWWAGR